MCHFGILPGILKETGDDARHYVDAEEAGNELLLGATDISAPQYAATGLSPGGREFPKLKQEDGDKEETLTLLAEGAGFSMCGFGFLVTDWGSALIVGGERRLYRANTAPKMRFGANVYGVQSGTESPILTQR